jgi:TolB protein
MKCRGYCSLFLVAVWQMAFCRMDNAIEVMIPLSGSLQNPVFSPDNNSILFTRFRDGYNLGISDLYLFNLQTHVLTSLVSDGSSNVNLPGSSWNGFTNKITFSSTRGNHDEIYIIAANGTPTNGMQITNRINKQSFEPSLSMDGQWLVFESHDIDVEQGVISKYKTDGGSSYIDLTTLAINAKQPNWSPVAQKILYQQINGAIWSIWTMNDDGSNKTRITNPLTESATDAVFSGDGQWIVYSSENTHTTRASIYRINTSGGTPIRITNDTAYDGAPSISKDGSKVVFESINAAPDGSAGTRLWIISQNAFGLIFQNGFEE